MSLDHRIEAIVFTDLDGTLLDHHSYSCGPALPALEKLKLKKIPVIISTSKTLDEIVVIREKIGNTHPFIAENGSVVAVETSGFPENKLASLGFEKQGGFMVARPGGDRNEILAFLNKIRSQSGYKFEGFADMTVSTICHLTGLQPDEAAMARQRLSTEPIVWNDSRKNFAAFSDQLEAQGFAWVQGGRFISISRPFDKSDGIRLLLKLYQGCVEAKILTIGLGDSPNDRQMLEMMDIAVVIKAEHETSIALEAPDVIIKTGLKGPAGWNEAFEQIFAKHFNLPDVHSEGL